MSFLTVETPSAVSIYQLQLIKNTSAHSLLGTDLPQYATSFLGPHHKLLRKQQAIMRTLFISSLTLFCVGVAGSHWVVSHVLRFSGQVKSFLSTQKQAKYPSISQIKSSQSRHAIFNLPHYGSPPRRLSGARDPTVDRKDLDMWADDFLCL